MKFKVGQKVFDLRYGVGEVLKPLHQHEEALVKVKFKRKPEGFWFNRLYLPKGFSESGDLLPTLWTLEEARERGYGDQLPKDPFKWAGTVCIDALNDWARTWQLSTVDFAYGGLDDLFRSSIVGKPVRITIEEIPE